MSEQRPKVAEIWRLFRSSDPGPVQPAVSVPRQSTGGEAGAVSAWDVFEDDISAGHVIGSIAAPGIIRKGIDKEKVISIDNGALRIQPLIKPGWGRAGIAYGPFTRANGLAFATLLLNGHNISRTSPLPDGLLMRLWRWIVGSETEPPLRRMYGWIRSGRTRFMWRQLQQWIKTGTKVFQIPPFDENLAVGWFPSEAPADPLHQGNALIVHAVIPEGGELWARLGGNNLCTVRGLQNIPMYYLIVLREKGAAYYAASMPGVPGLDAYPTMRVLAIDAFNEEEMVYAGIHQSVLGETGFRADTRVFMTHVAALPEFSSWYGSAHGADALTGEGPLHQSLAEVGGVWKVYEGSFSRSERGAIGSGSRSTAVLELERPSGLVHVLVESTDDPACGVAVVWRALDGDNYWSVEAGRGSCHLALKEAGRWFRFPAVRNCRVVPNAVNALQVFDDGENIRVYLNNDLVYGTELSDARLNHATGAGMSVAGTTGVRIHSFEAHPRHIPVPSTCGPGRLWAVEGTRVVIADNFDGPSADLMGRVTPTGGKEWRRDIGVGVIEVTGQVAAKVRGSVTQPCPGRTAYTVEWSNPMFADVAATITPPGTQKGLGETGRAGLIFWQDARNYLILSAFIGDYPAMSVAAFFQVNGFEELYDAVWSNTGGRMHPGLPHEFRVVFDGRCFLASINGEPVLYRALRDVYPACRELLITRVGIVANWEWGNDTGSVFQNFVARALNEA